MLSKEEALDQVGGLVERLVKIAKKNDLEISDYEVVKKKLREVLFEELKEEIVESISPSTEKSELKGLVMFGEIEEPIVPLKRLDESIIPVEVGREDTESDLPTMGIKLEKYPSVSSKRIEEEGTANADF
uniref:Uncharacterized protein n=2 Tax=Methanomicrobia TaxID=224756 RepID=A0A7H1KP98_9EURY|nr:hypothetical protein KICHMFME_00006 [Methanosarcinales archaeon ANME-1 ERB7]QNT35762.1 hypothetical protein MCFLDGBP_00010 [uncultured Methanosarcinales archaeon]